MKSQAISLKIWIGITICFIVFQYFLQLYFEEKIFYSEDKLSVSDGHFYRLERDYKNTTSDVLKVAVIGSSRVAKGIECPDGVHKILENKNLPPIQLNKIWESFDPFERLVENKNFLKRLIPLQPDLICVQAEMLAIQMPGNDGKKGKEIKNTHKRIWRLEYKGDEQKYISKKLKYQSKVNQELVYKTLNANTLFKGEGPCTIHDNYANLDTTVLRERIRSIKRMEDIQYTFDDLEMLNKAGIKVVVIETPFPHEVEKASRTTQFVNNLQEHKEELKKSFDIDYWHYTGPPLYYKYFADAGHLNPEGRAIYTEWLLDKVQNEVVAK